MILLFDEDLGRRVPEALRLVELAEVLPFKMAFPLGAKDPEWLPGAGKQGWLVFSCNKQILKTAKEREIIIKERVGIVLKTSGHEKRAYVLRLVLNKWDWLQYIDEHVQRPFAFYLYPSGRTSQVLLSRQTL